MPGFLPNDAESDPPELRCGRAGTTEAELCTGADFIKTKIRLSGCSFISIV